MRLNANRVFGTGEGGASKQNDNLYGQNDPLLFFKRVSQIRLPRLRSWLTVEESSEAGLPAAAKVTC